MLSSVTTDIFSVLTILAQILILVVVIALVTKRGEFFAKKAFTLSFIVAVVATAGSLFYSEVIGFEPCKLCWFQRILIYPQVIILGFALKNKQGIAVKQSFTLALIGAAVSLYHYLVQISPSVRAACDTIGYSASCSQRFALEYGYITIPMMALTTSILIGVLMLARKFSKK